MWTIIRRSPGRRATPPLAAGREARTGGTRSRRRTRRGRTRAAARRRRRRARRRRCDGGRRPPTPARTAGRAASSCDALRHGSTGATAIRNSRAKPIGIVMRSKYGHAHRHRSPLTASTTNGKTVPRSTTNANRRTARCWRGTRLRGEMGESIVPGDRNRSPRHPMRPTTRDRRGEEAQQARPDRRTR